MPHPVSPAPAGDARAPVLAAERLGIQRGERPLFAGLQFELQPGQVVWLRGRNGRGKTSLLRLLAGLSTPAQGSVSCDGQALARLSAQWRRRLLYIAHANALKDMSAYLASHARPEPLAPPPPPHPAKLPLCGLQSRFPNRYSPPLVP